MNRRHILTQKEGKDLTHWLQAKTKDMIFFVKIQHMTHG